MIITKRAGPRTTEPAKPADATHHNPGELGVLQYDYR